MSQSYNMFIIETLIKLEIEYIIKLSQYFNHNNEEHRRRDLIFAAHQDCYTMSAINYCNLHIAFIEEKIHN